MSDQENEDGFIITKISQVKSNNNSSENKTDDKLQSNQKVANPVNITSNSSQNQQPSNQINTGEQEDDDEESMYEEKKIEKTQGAEDELVKKMEEMLIQEAKNQYRPKDQLMIFTGYEFFRYDFGWRRWHINDMEEGFKMPELCHVVKVKDQTNRVHMLVSGGYLDDLPLSDVVGIKFSQEDTRGEILVQGAPALGLTNLPDVRYMHQSVILNNEKGKQVLYVLGGREGTQKNWSNSVISLDLHLFLMPEAKNKSDKSKDTRQLVQWQKEPSMNSARSNFAAVAIKNKIYVYGGIQGRQQEYHPQIVDNLIEVYDPSAKIWEELKIDNAPYVAAFGWAYVPKKESIVILGGSDGNIIMEEQWEIDFLNKKATLQPAVNNAQLAMCKLVYREMDETLHSVAGYGSQGSHIFMKLGAKEWKESDKDPTTLVNNQQFELQFNEHIFFD